MPVRSTAKLSILVSAAFAVLPLASARAYPPFPLVYQNLFRASLALMKEMKIAEKKKCLTDAEKNAFTQRVARLEQEIDSQLKRPDSQEFFGAGAESVLRPDGLDQTPGDVGVDSPLPVTAGGALGSSPRFELTYTKEALDQELKVLEGKEECSDVPQFEDFGPNPPSRALGGSGERAVGGGFFERTGIQTYVGLEVGGGGAKASYDELIIDPKSFVGGAFMGVRIPQPNNWFIGAQAGFFGTDLTREAAPRFEVGLRSGWTLDAQVGKTVRTAWRPITLYVFAGPMIGRTRTTSAGITDYFTLFGVTAGAGADVKITQHWALGGKVRWFSLDPSDAKSQGQHVDGAIGTVSLMYRF